MAKDEYQPNAAVRRLMLEFNYSRIQNEDRPVDGEVWLSGAMSLELAVLEAKLELANYAFPGNFPNERAIRRWTEEQEVSNVFMEAVGTFPYEPEYTAAMVQGSMVPESGFAIRTASLDPLRYCFIYDPPAVQP